MVSHDPDDARRIAEKTVFLADGLANVPVDTAGLFAQPTAGLKAYLGDMKRI